MLCEGRLWRVVLCTDQDNVDPPLPAAASDPQDPITRTGSQSSAAPLLSTPPSLLNPTLRGSPDQRGRCSLPRAPQGGPHERGGARPQPPEGSPYRALQPQQRARSGGRVSPQMEIPGRAHSAADAPFLVPSSCQSICQNYSDLHIGGDQVMPLSARDGELLSRGESQADRPFLHSCDVLPAGDDSPPDRALLTRAPRAGSTRLSCRERSFILQGREGPLSNSLLNRYLEHKLLDLYRQYMLESMAREGARGSDPGSAFPLLGSELVLTSLDYLTLQLSRDGNLEAGRAKDMVLSCLLRVASDLGESQISTPLLQISDEGSHGQVESRPEVESQVRSQSEVQASTEEIPFDSSDTRGSRLTVTHL